MGRMEVGREDKESVVVRQIKTTVRLHTTRQVHAALHAADSHSAISNKRRNQRKSPDGWFAASTQHQIKSAYESIKRIQIDASDYGENVRRRMGREDKESAAVREIQTTVRQHCSLNIT